MSGISQCTWDCGILTPQCHIVIPEKEPSKGKPSVGHIVIPYTQGLGESIKICGKYGKQVHFKGNRTLKAVVSQAQGPEPNG